MASENNIFLCVIFSIGIGLCFAISGAIPAYFAAKDREIDEYYNKDNQNEEASKREDDRIQEERGSYSEENMDVDIDHIHTEKEDTSDHTKSAQKISNGELGSWFAWFAEEYNNADIEEALQKPSKSKKEENKIENEAITKYEEHLNNANVISEKDIQGSEVFLDDEHGDAHPGAHIEEQIREKTSACMWKFASFGSIVFQFLGVVFNYFALLYGPVSICTPISSCSLILFNVIIFAYILKIEKKPNKETRVGNFFHEKGGNYFSDNFNFIAFQASILTLGSLSANSLKVVSNSEGWFFWANAVIFGVCFVVFPFVGIYQNVVIKNPATFSSINAGLTYLMNVFVGLFCWKDQIINWGGYVLSWTMFILGIYLVSDVDLLAERIDKNTEEDIDKNLIWVDEGEPDARRPNITRFSIVPGTHLETTFTKAHRRSAPSSKM